MGVTASSEVPSLPLPFRKEECEGQGAGRQGGLDLVLGPPGDSWKRGPSILCFASANILKLLEGERD